MKATGIVRRIDDLGRVVIPKEIRRTMRIREGDPLEIFTNKDGEVIFKKYSPIGELGNFASDYAETLSKISGYGVAISDKDVIIAVSGSPKKELMEFKISGDIEKIMKERTQYSLQHPEDKKFKITEANDKYCVSVCIPIISEGDCIGSVIFYGTQEITVMGDVEFKLAQSAAHFLGKQMEE